MILVKKIGVLDLMFKFKIINCIQYYTKLS